MTSFNIHKGIITQVDRKSKNLGIGIEDFGLIIKKILTQLRVPYSDPLCAEMDGISPLRLNEETGNIEYLVDPINHIYAPLDLTQPYGTRYNPHQKILDYYDPVDEVWVTIGKVVGPGQPGGTPSDGILFEDGSIMVFNDNTILTF